MGRLTRIASVLLVLAACGEESNNVGESKGAVVAEEDALDFGAVFVGDRGVVRVRVQNRSRLSGTLAVDIKGPFRLVPGESLDLAPGAVVTVELEYRPTEEKPVSGSATFSISGVPDSATVELTAEGSKRAVQAVPALDLGTLDLAQSKTVELEVKSLAKIPLVVGARVEGDEAFAFTLGAQQLAIPPNGTARLPITFRPQREEQHRTTLELKPCPAQQACESFSVALTGSGLIRRVTLSRQEVEFGDVPVGDSAQALVDIRNDGSVAVWVSAVVLQDGPGSPFTLDVPELPTSLDAGRRLTLDLGFVPQVEGEFSALVQVEAGGKILELPVSGTGGSGDFLIEPAVIDFGVAPSGVGRSAFITLRDVGTDTPVKITGIRVDNDPSSAFLVTFPFGLPTTARTEPREVEVIFNAPSPGVFEAEVTISPEVGSNRRVLVRGEGVQGSWCDLEVIPATANFGMVTVGETATRTITVRNKLNTACSVADFHVTGSAAFQVTGLPEGRQTIGAKGSLAIQVTYQPTRTGIVPEVAELTFQQTTQENQIRTVALSGVGTEANLAVVPAALDFGAQPNFSSTLKSLDVRNAGARPVQIRKVEIPAGDITLYNQGSRTSLPPGVQTTLNLEFRPRAAGTLSGELKIWLVGAVEPFIVPLTGTGEAKTCTTQCDTPVVVCPAAQAGFLQRGFELVGGAKDARGQAVSCTWEITAAPAGSAAAPVFDGDCGHPASFQADVAGNYTLKLTGTDGETPAQSCTVDVQAPAFQGLWVETRWDLVDEVNVHLFRPEAGRIDRVGPWRTGTHECWEGAPSPAWGDAGSADDPVLEKGSGMGPEIVRIESPKTGTKYQLGVHWPTTAYGNPALQVETTIWCGGAPVTSYDFSLTSPFSAVDLGTIDVTSSTSCTFTAAGSSITVLP